MPHPTTRVLAVLELLQSHDQIGGAELARRVEVDRRTLRRYIAMLEEMGIPITTEQGRYGGYRLVPGYKLPPMMFTDEEAQALSLGLIAARGLGLADAAPAIESVQAKLDRVLPSAPRRTIAALRESVALQTGDRARQRGREATARAVGIRAVAPRRRSCVIAQPMARSPRATSTSTASSSARGAGTWWAFATCARGCARCGSTAWRMPRSRSACSRGPTDSMHRSTSPALATLPRAIPVELFLHTDLANAKREVHPTAGVEEACPAA